MFALHFAGARSQHASADGARHAEQVLKVSHALERRVIDLETGVRGYLLTRDGTFLEPYEQARARSRASWPSSGSSPASRRRRGWPAS